MLCAHVCGQTAGARGVGMEADGGGGRVGEGGGGGEKEQVVIAMGRRSFVCFSSSRLSASNNVPTLFPRPLLLTLPTPLVQRGHVAAARCGYTGRSSRCTPVWGGSHPRDVGHCHAGRPDLCIAIWGGSDPGDDVGRPDWCPALWRPTRRPDDAGQRRTIGFWAARCCVWSESLLPSLYVYLPPGNHCKRCEDTADIAFFSLFLSRCASRYSRIMVRWTSRYNR